MNSKNSITCPHCLRCIFVTWTECHIGNDKDGIISFFYTKCPSCLKFICIINQKLIGNPLPKESLVYPKVFARSPLPKEVPNEYASDYREACLVISDSPKASAALSRRCLQNLLREVEKAKLSNLSSEIQEIIDRGKLPSWLSENLDTIRTIGNFAAHPTKSKNTGEIIDVEPGEAEWSLNVLEGLFDYYFVLPTKQKEKKKALELKLEEAGKKKSE